MSRKSQRRRHTEEAQWDARLPEERRLLIMRSRLMARLSEEESTRGDGKVTIRKFVERKLADQDTRKNQRTGRPG